MPDTAVFDLRGLVADLSDAAVLAGDEFASWEKIAGLEACSAAQVDRLGVLVAEAFAKLDNPDADGRVPDEVLAKLEKFAEAAGHIEAESARRGRHLAARAAVTGSTDTARKPTRAALAQRSDAGSAARARARRRTPVPTTLSASANLPGSPTSPPVSSGEQISWRHLAAGLSEALSQGRHRSGGADGENVPIAQLAWNYPEELQLDDNSWSNNEKLDAALSIDAIMARADDAGISALVAAGGICDPLPVDYSIPVQSVTDRPVKDALPSFQAIRGGIRFIPTPTFAGVGASASTIWTSAIDATATTATPKPVQTFNCPTATQELVDAIPTRAQFSNMQGRFSPEYVAANVQLAIANAARMAEQNLLAKISARSTITGASSLISFTRDLMALLELLAQGYRYRNRLPDGFPLSFLAPMWTKGAMRVDLLRTLAHGPDDDNLVLADDEINALFAARGLVPTWTIDGLAKSVVGTTLSAAGTPYDWPDQFFAAQASGALPAPIPDASANSAVANVYWPKRLSFFLFAPGTFVFLDGGRIDLGVVRDSVLNNLNQYQTFVEPFEGIAKRGYESIQCTVPLLLSGVTQAAATVAVSGSPY